MSSKPLNIAIIGASYRSSMLLNFIKKHPEQIRLRGFYDLIQQRSRCLAEHYGQNEVKYYESIDAVVTDNEVEAVFIGTSDNAHVEPCVMALQAGKHVYCEKPLAITLDDCDTITTAAKNSDAIFYLGMNLRHSPVHEKIHDLIVDGTLGEVLTIEANEYYSGGRSYFRRWNRLRQHSGGLWLTKACHDFDLLNWMAGAKAKKVFAVSNLSFYRSKVDAGNYCRECSTKDSCRDFYDIASPNDELQDKLLAITEKVTGAKRDICLFNSDKDTFDNGVAVVEYENDIRATYTVNVVSGRDTRQMRIMGTAASLEGDMERGFVKVWPRYNGEPVEFDLTRAVAESTHGGADDGILKDFIRCCRTGDNPRSSWADGRNSIEVPLAARKSCDENKVVIL